MLLRTIALGLIAAAATLTPATAADKGSVAQIKDVVLASYVHGAFNALDPDAMRRGFHEDFAIFSPTGEELSKYPIADWADSAAKRKAKPDFDPADNAWTHKFSNIDVTGHAATVKIELWKDGRHVYTDYLSLLQFDSGWRIVAKVYYKHPE